MKNTKDLFSKDLFKKRREQLRLKVKENHPANSSGALILIAGFESEKHEFRQESSFYYYTGITEPGCMMVINLEGKETLYVPIFDGQRQQWVSSVIVPGSESAKQWGFDEVQALGEAVKGYSLPLLFADQDIKNIVGYCKSITAKQGTIFTLNNDNPRSYVEQKIVLGRMQQCVSQMTESLVDISPIVAQMRRAKSKAEIELLYKAMEVTIVAQQGAASTIEPGKKEYEIRAGIEYVFQESNCSAAFPSIVASGRNSVILHARASGHELKNGELVVVDIGAEYNYYCADITRTYPVSGTFTKRQKEVYQIVLDTQDYIAQIAAPGFWINNKNQPDRSLNHLAKTYLENKGYGSYFCHSIGHFLGLDVHDVGDYNEPLKEGDVFTIEPGIYIENEELGIRIEDDYWVVKDGVVCLSEDLPKDISSIEEMAQASLFDEEEDEGYDD